MAVNKLLTSKPFPLRSYGVVMASVALALLVTLWLKPILNHSVFILFFAAVSFSAWDGGLKSGLLATVLSVIACNYFFLPSIYFQKQIIVAPIEAAIEIVRLAAQAKLIEIKTVYPLNVVQVAGDYNRLQQVFWNLLSNAVKFTSMNGQVEVQLSASDTHAQIQISDTGQGIHPDFLPYVFDYFRQENSTTTRECGGLGLGLAIVRHIVELHGGTVTASSPGVGVGSTFIVTFPLMSVVSDKTEKLHIPSKSPDFTSLRVLVVDDDLDTRELVVFILKEYGATVNHVASAQQVLDVLPSWQPDLLISDIGMPEMDGYTLLRQLRALPVEKGGQIPALALTAYAQENDFQQMKRAGFTRYITKPVDPMVLTEVVAELIGKK